MILAAAVLLCATAQPDFVDPELQPFVEEAEALRPLVETDAMRAFLDEVAWLQPVSPRTVYYRMGEDPVAYRSDEMDALTDEQKEGLRSHDVTTSRFYSTFYGSPLAYARALDLAVAAGLDDFDDKRIADMGYGAIMHLRLMAMRGADVTGIEILPVLRAMYSNEGDQGEIEGSDGRTGNVRLIHGYWPVDVGEEVGDGYDLFMSRNTLKRGYINPTFETPAYQQVKLGVSDEEFTTRIFDTLAPGGLALVYNIGAGDPGEGEAYNAPADIHDPFPREVWEAAGFEIVAYDADDDQGARAVARALGWDEGERPMAIDELHGRYTIVRRPD